MVIALEWHKILILATALFWCGGFTLNLAL